MKQESKKTAIITGSGRGIGKETAIILAKKCDVSIPSEVNSLVKSAIEKFGSETIDIFVNNAGVAFNRKLVDTPNEEWDQTINSNLKGAFLFSKAVLPYMI